MPAFHNLIRSDFMRHNAIYFAGSMAVAFLNYLYHPILSRLLSPRHFGEVQTIFSLSLATGIVLGSFGMVVLNIISNKEHEPERERILPDLQSIALYLVLLITILIVLAQNRLASSLQFDSPVPFLVLAAILATSVAYTFRRYYLQARSDFVALSISGFIVASGRLLIAVALVYIGLETFGALAGLVVAQIIAFIYLKSRSGSVSSLALKKAPNFSPQVMRELRYGGLVLLAFGAISFFTSMDVVYAKYYFAPETAGVYSGISTVARIIYFATSSVAAVLISSVRLNRPAASNAKVLRNALVLLLGIGGGGLALFWLFPDLVIRTLLGAKFAPMSDLLPRLSVATFLASLVNLFFFYFLALRKYVLALISLAGVAVTASYIWRFHDSGADIVNGFILGSALGTLMLVILFFSHLSKSASQHGK